MPTGAKINGVTHSFQTVDADFVGGLIFENLVELNYKTSLDPGVRRNRAGNVTAFTHGDVDHEGDFTLPIEDSDEMILALCALRPTGNGFGLVAFDIVVNRSDGDSPVTTDTLVGCRVVELDSSNAQGNDQSVKKWGLKIANILHTGKQISDIGTTA